MSLSEKLRRDIWDAETEANREYGRFVKRVKEIRIHPEQYIKLGHDCCIGEFEAHSSGDRTFMGIPLEQDPEVEGWKIVI